jgi:hypothetical protein
MMRSLPTTAFRVLFSTLALCFLFSSAAGADPDPKRWFEDGDKVYVRQHERFERIYEPDVHLKRARRAYLKDHASLAADELEKAAAGMSYFADRSGGRQHRELVEAAGGLNKLADQARRREIGEITLLDDAIADAMRILAGEPKPAPPVAAPPPK